MATTERDWITEAGLRAAILRQPRGHLCGYVAVEAGHPLHRVPYNAECGLLKTLAKEAEAGTIGSRGIMPVFCAALRGEMPPTAEQVFDVHGSLTYSSDGDEGYPVDGAGLWWFGFDCSHAGDNPNDQTPEYVSAQCESLARQLAAITFQGV